MKLLYASSMDAQRLAQSLSLTARSQGVDGIVVERLARSERRESPEVYMRHLEDSLAGRLMQHSRIAGAITHHWCWHTLIDPLRRSETDELQKAQPGLGLTPQQITELRQLIEAHFYVPLGAHPVEWTIPQAAWERWKSAGILVEGFQIPEIDNAWTAGRLYQVIEEGHTFEDMVRLASQHVMSRAAQLSLQWAQASAAKAISGHGVKLGAQAAARSMTAHRRVARGLIEQYLQGRLPKTAPARGPAHDLTPHERRTLQTDKVVDSWQGLATELRRQFGHSDQDRDWARVAATETRLAFNIGRIQAMAEHRQEFVIYRVQPDACTGCKQLYLNPDGSPKVFRVRHLLDQIAETGGLNTGRKLSKLGDPDEGWVVTGGVLHPWCRCLPIPYMGTVPWTQ
jgi:hypothetical protein